jgi:hypothetical protein
MKLFLTSFCMGPLSSGSLIQIGHLGVLRSSRTTSKLDFALAYLNDVSQQRKSKVLDIKRGGAVIGIRPGVEFQIVELGIFRIETYYDWFTNGQFARSEVPGF